LTVEEIEKLIEDFWDAREQDVGFTVNLLAMNEPAEESRLPCRPG